jgi:solute:Na+ symporter, SSS family
MHPRPAGLAIDQSVPHFLSTMFPTGVLGLVLAATLAASLSSIASAVNSCTTVAMVDFYERLIKHKPKIPETVVRDTHGEGHQDVLLSRIVTICFGIVGMTLAANVHNLGNIIQIGQKVIQTFTGPLLGIYLLGMFTRRGTSLGALLGGITGTLLALYVAFGKLLADRWGLTAWGLGPTGIAFYWPTVLGFSATFLGGYIFSIVSGSKVSEAAQQLTWARVMRRQIPLTREELSAAALQPQA